LLGLRARGASPAVTAFAPVLVAVGVLAMAAVVQSLSGFGFAVVAIPLLSIVVEPAHAVVLVSCSDMLLCLGIWIRDRRHVSRRLVTMVTVAASVGMPVGLLLLTHLETRWLALLIAAILIVSIVFVLRPPRIGAGTASTLAAGLISGALLTSTGVNGPPLVSAAHARLDSPLAIRASLSAAFALMSVVGLVGFAVAGQLGGSTLLEVALAIPVVAGAGLLGDVIFRRLPRRAFRVITAVVLVAGGVGAIAMMLAQL
jgi:uncharacterized membrane protein YfcA